MKQETPKYSLKVATEEDFDDVKRLCLSFFHASIYNDKDIADDKVETLISEFIHLTHDRIAILGLLEGQPCGLIAGVVQPLLFNHARIASEIVWWVDEEHRRSKLGLQLLDAFEYWGEHIAKADYGQMVTLADDKSEHLDKYYRRRGYIPVEKAYLKTWQQ